ncbi:LysR substrate-binding domain-containing protein [Paucibacter sp. R3-3]|uniref:LysR substrate-binding domain-containing protein n=1 Tax=Roseateles agri TaxID=3098619 RepID=A0ABU5DJX2_9BURK|nr:LysR substrate-binding domain-containing protein [Paucibacter sp. R3-3]MDY0746600.1 LysR substrate-binding domain-containing protein [Paucibacter sp. R3-3]
MLDLNDFRFFVEVAERGGLSAAARALDKPVSTISYRIQQLEKELGLTLFARTSRHITLTENGTEFYGHAVATLARANEAELAMRSRSTEPTGTVRFTVAIATAQFAMPEMISSFLAKYPKVELVQHAGDSNVDIVADRLDFAIRAYSGALPDSTMVQRALAKAPWHLFASPGYLEAHGVPAAPEDLAGCATLFMKRDGVSPSWSLTHETDSANTVQVSLRPRITGSCMVTLKRAAEAGTGIVALPAYVCRDEVAAGRLRRVLPEWIAADATITALMPTRRGMSAATRAFIDHIAEAFPHAVRVS